MPGGGPIFQHLMLAHATLTAPAMSTEEILQMILWSDVVGQCLNDARAATPPRLIQGTVGRNMLVARLRFLGVQCDHTRCVICSMRSEFLNL